MATILIVDDRQSNRDYLATVLGNNGHRLLQAAGGAEALATAGAEHPDLVIADILMPVMDGFEFARQLRADPQIATTPIIFWTVDYREQEVAELARASGVSTVIAKPSTPEAVLSAVEAALGFKEPRERVQLPDKLSQADDLGSANERLSALADLNVKLGSELDLPRLLRSFAQAAREIIGARFSITGILDGEGIHFQTLATSGMDADTPTRIGSPDPQGAVLRTILRDGRSVRMRNPGGHPEALGLSASHPRIHAWLGVPIAWQTKVYGYIGLIDKVGADEFSQQDERLAGTLASQIGRIYQSGNLYSGLFNQAEDLEREMAAHAQTEQALAERLRQGSLFGEVGLPVTQSDTLQEMLQLCAGALVRHLDVAFARIWTFSGAEQALELKASAGLYTHIDGSHSRIALGQFKVGRIAQERTPHFTNDMLNDPDVSDKEWAKRENMVAFAGYPLVVDDRLLGVVAVFAHRPLNAATVDAIELVAHEIALGIERNRANEALREREEHVRLLLDSAAEAIYGIDMRGRCTFANAACARLLGYANSDQLLGQNMHALMHHTRKDGNLYPPEQCKIHQAFRQNQGSHVDDEVLWRADGSSFPAEYWSYPICRDGQVVGSVVTFLDITERRQLEERFRQAEQRIRDVVASSPAVLLTLAVAQDRIQSITGITDNLLGFLGYPPTVAIGSDWWPANVHPDDLERVRTNRTGDLFTRGHSEQEYRFRHADGDYRWTRCEMRLIRDESGQPVEAVGAWLDITERKAAEEEQAKLREQLQQAQKLESIGRLAGGVAHDFNNLLTVINGYGDLVLKRLAPADPVYKMVDEMRKAGQRAAELTKQLLVLSRREVAQTRAVNLNDVIAEVEKMLARVIGEDIRLESVLSPSLGNVFADPGQLHQVLMNLAVNARDAMPAGGTLLIETANADLEESYVGHHAEVKPGPYVQLKVSDTGIGMTKDVMSHLFEPFFTTKKPGEGTGLGLATVYGIVKQSGGSIWVYSEPGEGATFSIYLPRSDAGVKHDQEPSPVIASLVGAETILLVEDQEQLRKLAGSVLRSYGYRVLEAANAGEALLHCERYAGMIHLLLTDVVMPGMAGPELAARLKPLRPTMEVLFMSGHSERAITDRIDLSGSYLPKPFSPEALAVKVRGVLGAPRSAGTIMIVDDDPGVRSFLRVILTGVSYEVLEATDGEEALRLLDTSAVDVAVMDLGTAEQQGIESILALRRARPQLKIVATSAHGAGGILHAAEPLGVDVSLAKPIQPQELLDAIARVVVGSC